MVIQLGQTAETRRVFTAADIQEYIALGGQTPVDGAVPGPLVGALFSYLLGVRLPGVGTNYLKQETDYRASARMDQLLIARVEVVRLRPEKHLVDLRTTCHSDNGVLLCDGRALVYIEDAQL